MKSEHLTDAEIQQYVLHPSDCEVDISVHLEGCEKCRLETNTYRVLFSAIGQEPKSAFDFDLAAMVLTRLTNKVQSPEAASLSASIWPEETARDEVTARHKAGSPGVMPRSPLRRLPSFVYALVLAGAALTGILVYLFRLYLMPVIKGIGQMSLYLTILTTVIIFFFQLVETYKKYQQQLRSLNQ